LGGQNGAKILSHNVPIKKALFGYDVEL